MLATDIQSKIRRLRIMTRKAVNSFAAGCYRSAFRGQGSEPEDLREYTVGDDIKAIDWKVTARTGSPHVKTYREERDLRVLALLDRSGSMHFGTWGGLKYDKALEALAFVGFTVAAVSDRFGSLFFSNRVESFIPPAHGSGQVLKILGQALTSEPPRSGTDLSAALSYVARLRLKRSVIFVLSDFQDWKHFRQLQVLARFHDVICIVISDKGEHHLPSSGLVSFKDPETHEIIDVDLGNRAFRRLWERAKGLEQDEIVQGIRGAGLDCLHIDTLDDTVRKMGAFYASLAQQRMRRGG